MYTSCHLCSNTLVFLMDATRLVKDLRLENVSEVDSCLHQWWEELTPEGSSWQLGTSINQAIKQKHWQGFQPISSWYRRALYRSNRWWQWWRCMAIHVRGLRRWRTNVWKRYAVVLKHLLNSTSCLVTSVQVPLKQHNVFQWDQCSNDITLH